MTNTDKTVIEQACDDVWEAMRPIGGAFWHELDERTRALAVECYKDALASHTLPAPGEWQAVPQKMRMDGGAAKAITFMLGSADADDDTPLDAMLWVGDLEGDDDKPVHGLHLANAEYPEEGSITLVEFAALRAASITPPAPERSKEEVGQCREEVEVYVLEGEWGEYEQRTQQVYGVFTTLGEALSAARRLKDVSEAGWEEYKAVEARYIAIAAEEGFPRSEKYILDQTEEEMAEQRKHWDKLHEIEQRLGPKPSYVVNPDHWWISKARLNSIIVSGEVVDSDKDEALTTITGGEDEEFSITLKPTRTGFKHPHDDGKLLRLWVGQTNRGQSMSMLSYGFYCTGSFDGMDYTPVDASEFADVPRDITERISAVNALTAALSKPGEQG